MHDNIPEASRFPIPSRFRDGEGGPLIFREAGGSTRAFELSSSRMARRNVSKLCITEYVMTHNSIVIHNMEFINYNLKIP
jgi:hypothetical protein